MSDPQAAAAHVSDGGKAGCMYTLSQQYRCQTVLRRAASAPVLGQSCSPPSLASNASDDPLLSRSAEEITSNLICKACLRLDAQLPVRLFYWAVAAAGFSPSSARRRAVKSSRVLSSSQSSSHSFSTFGSSSAGLHSAGRHQLPPLGLSDTTAEQD